MQTSAMDVDLIGGVQNNTVDKLVERDAIKNQIETEERKKKFFNETIHIKLKYGKNNNNEKTKEWRIKRFRLTNEFLQQSVDRILSLTDESGAIIAYLKESGTGEVVIPDEIQMSCRSNTSTCSYDMFLTQPNKTRDVLKSNNNGYRGQMKFMLHNVPLQSQNSMHELKSDHVQNWIIDGVLCEDPAIREKENRIKVIKNNLDLTIRRMGRVADEPAVNERGHILTGKKAEKKREEKFVLLQKEKDMLYNQLDEVIIALKESKKEVVEKVNISIVQHIDDRTTWEFMFTGEAREYFDDIVVTKNNWNTSFMYANSQISSFSNDYSIPDSEYLVDTGGVLIERLEDGFGCFHKRNLDTMGEIRDHNSHVDIYHGTYRDGKKSGFGVLYRSAGIYGGEMKNDQPCDNGTLVTKDGDVLRGQFNPCTVTSDKRPNRYTRSLPNRENEVQFSDGAFYKGSMKNGIITGNGIYVSSEG